MPLAPQRQSAYICTYINKTKLYRYIYIYIFIYINLVRVSRCAQILCEKKVWSTVNAIYAVKCVFVCVCVCAYVFLVYRIE